MNQSFWIQELGRLFKRASESIRVDDNKGVKILVGDFNEALTNLKDKYPDNTIINSTEPVEPTEEKFLMATRERTGETSSSTYEGVRKEALYEVRSNCERIANSLEYRLPRDSEADNPDNMIIVQMESINSANQEQISIQNQNLSFEQTIEMVNHTHLNHNRQKELKEIIRQFETELSDEEPDVSTLRDLLQSAKGYSVDVAAKMAMIALSDGMVDVLGF